MHQPHFLRLVAHSANEVDQIALVGVGRIASDRMDRRPNINLSPIQINIGNAASAHELLAPQTEVANTEPMGALLNQLMQTKPTTSSDMATHKPLPSRANKKIISRIE